MSYFAPLYNLCSSACTKPYRTLTQLSLYLIEIDLFFCKSSIRDRKLWLGVRSLSLSLKFVIGDVSLPVFSHSSMASSSYENPSAATCGFFITSCNRRKEEMKKKTCLLENPIIFFKKNLFLKWEISESPWRMAWNSVYSRPPLYLTPLNYQVFLWRVLTRTSLVVLLLHDQSPEASLKIVFSTL